MISKFYSESSENDLLLSLEPSTLCQILGLEVGLSGDPNLRPIGFPCGLALTLDDVRGDLTKSLKRKKLPNPCSFGELLAFKAFMPSLGAF